MSPQTIGARIAELKREVQRESRPREPGPPAPSHRRPRDRSTSGNVVRAALMAAAVVALPFAVYVRASVFFYVKGAPPWLAVLGAALLTTTLLAGYGAWLARRFPRRGRGLWVVRWVAIPAAAAWCSYAALYLSRVNAKSDVVRSYYGSVHPVLRVALGTAILVDQRMVVTDLWRVPEDYARMGLPVNDRTLHYRQADGWVHAVDLRTRERGELRNLTLQWYFSLMGFSTLRHVGTSDHLHVQLSVRS